MKRFLKKFWKVLTVVLLVSMAISTVAMACVQIERLNLTFMQPCEPADGSNPEQARWRVRNPNDFEVTYDVWKAGEGIIMEDQTAPPGDSFFYTPWGAQTLKIIWGGGSKTKAGGDTFNGEICIVVEDKEQCIWQQYVLRDTRGNLCYIKRNYYRGDVAGHLPEVYDNTQFMRQLCSKDCLGNPVNSFGQLDTFWTTCAQCDGACE